MAAPMAKASSRLMALLGVLPKISPCPDQDCELTLDGGAHGNSLIWIDSLADDLLALIRIVNLPWMAAPMAKALSRLTALLGFLPKIFLQVYWTLGIPVIPPTSSTSPMSDLVTSASFMACDIQKELKGSHIIGLG
jgi:hypothetical protein